MWLQGCALAGTENEPISNAESQAFFMTRLRSEALSQTEREAVLAVVGQPVREEEGAEARVGGGRHGGGIDQVFADRIRALPDVARFEPAAGVSSAP